MADLPPAVDRQMDRRLALSFGAVVLLLLLTVAGVAAYLDAELRTQQENRLSSALAQALAESISRVSFAGKYQTRLLVADMQQKVPELVFISVESPDGTVLAHSEPHHHDQPVPPEDAATAQESLRRNQEVVTDRLREGRILKEVVLPYRAGLDTNAAGVVRLGIDIATVRAEQQENLLRLLGLIALLALLAIGVVFLLSRRFGASVRALATHLQGILHHAPMAISIGRPAGREVAQGGAEQLFGAAAGESVARALEQRLARPELDTLAGIDREVLDRGAPAETELEVRLPDRTALWQVSKFPIERDASGRVSLICTFIRDITERKRAEAALQEKTRELDRYFASSLDLLCIADTSGHFVRLNPEWERALGYSVAEMEGRMFLDFVHPDDLEQTLAAVAKLKDQEQVLNFENRYRCKDGSYRVIEWRSMPQGDRIHAVAHDITARKRTEQELRESEETLSKVIAAAQDAIVIIDAAGRVTLWNPSAERIFGYSAAEMVGQPVHRLVAGAEAHQLIGRRMADFGAAGQGPMIGRMMELTSRRKSGEEFSLELSLAAVMLKGSWHAIGILRDITDRKHAQTEREKLLGQLNQAQKMESVGRLAGGVAHDFNNMLNVILGHAELALEQVPPSAPIFGDLQEILKAAHRSSELTRQLLAFARKQTVTPQVLELNETVEGMLRMLRRLIGEDIELAWVAGQALWPVLVDPSQIDQLLANLCVNARDAIGGVGKVTIETRNVPAALADTPRFPGSGPGEWVMLAVSDTGCGMSPEVLEHLFEPFFTTKDLGRGTGLGLATVYGIVKQNNGAIQVASQPGQGTTFRIYLPRHAGEPAPAPEAPSPPPVPSGKETILLVEDEAAILLLSKRVLERKGYTVLAAGGPAEALRLARAHSAPIDLLVTDVVMPEMNGRRLAEQLTALHPRLRCLFTSGYTADVIAHHGVLEEGIRFLPKPFSPDDLALKVREAIDAPGSESNPLA